jgi:hypothetical protein
MSMIRDFSLDSSGFNAFSWFDIGSPRDDGGQTLSFPDYVYGTIQEVCVEANSIIILKMRTVDGAPEIRVVPGTNFIGCLPDDMTTGRKAAVAVSRDNGRMIARKVMMFSGGE